MRTSSVACVLMATCWLVQARTQESVVKETNVAYYVSMTVEGLNYAVACYGMAKPKEKANFARNISLHMFQYTSIP